MSSVILQGNKTLTLCLPLVSGVIDIAVGSDNAEVGRHLLYDKVSSCSGAACARSPLELALVVDD